MKMGFVINDLKTESPSYTTVGIGHAATLRGHEAWFINVADFTYDPDRGVCAHAVSIAGAFETQQEFYRALSGDGATRRRIETVELDALLMRHDPAEESDKRPWAQYSPILFGQLAARAETPVFNEPRTLASALAKTYFQQFPEFVRPCTLISRNRNEIREFVSRQANGAVLKPLQGSGGKNVFLVKNGGPNNLNQIVEVLSASGYVVAQEYLPQAAAGDVRLFVMNGEALCVGGRYAAIRRVNATDDIRSNIHAGGRAVPAEVTDEMLKLVEAVRPKLIMDGMFLVGLDIVGDKLMEVNVFTPGGLHMMSQMYGVDFFAPVIAALERKAAVRNNYRRSLENIALATM